MNGITRTRNDDLPYPLPAKIVLPSQTWLKPDPLFLKRGRRPAPPLPGDEIFGTWDPWICDAAEMTGVPRDYVAIPLTVAMAALIGNARVVSPWRGWQEPAIIWGGVVGDPSSGKSPGADPVLAAVRDVEKELGEGFDEKLRDWESLATSAKASKVLWEEAVGKAVKAGDKPPTMPAAAVVPLEPERPRIITSDVTPERLGALLDSNRKGLLNIRDELSGWLLGFDRYSKGGERSFWLEAFGGRPFTIDRVKAGGSVHIDHLSISVFGGMQPDRLTSLLLSSDDDGLSSRFILAWPDPLPPSRPRTAASGQFIRRAFAKLAALEPLTTEDGDAPAVLMLTPDAADEFQEWRSDHDRLSHRVSGMVLSAWGKMPGLLLRLAMILELGAWATEPDGTAEPSNVSKQAIIRAVGFVESYLKPMLDRVYGDASVPPNERHAMTLARWIAHTGLTKINARDVGRTAGLPGLKSGHAVEAAIEVLIEADWLRPDVTPSGGRRRKDYLVNPSVPDLVERQYNGDGG